MTFSAVIDQETVQRVREQTDIVSLIGETVKLTRSGRSLKGLCPFHKEKSPSFNVNADTGRFYCFGCQASGDAFAFVMQTEGLTFVEAVRHLADRAGIAIVESRSPREVSEEAEARRRKQELYDVSNAAATYFEQMRAEHPLGALAQEELARRALVPTAPTDPIADALQAFRVGYAPYGWDGLVRYLAKAGLSPRAAETVGLIVPRKSGGGYYDRFRHRLMFAVTDLQGRVIAFSGRALDEPTPLALERAHVEATGKAADPDAKAAKYINSAESPIYRKGETVFGLFQARQHIRQSEQCVLVEGNFDVLSLHARGIRNVVAPLGTAFTVEQATQIRRFAPTLVFLFDGDRAGRAAVAKSRGACQDAGLSAKVASLPDGVDPDELVREAGPEALTKRIGAARGILEHLIDSALDYLPPKHDAEARLARIRQVAALVSDERDEALRAMARVYVHGAIASRMNVEDEATFRELIRHVDGATRASASTNGPTHHRAAGGPRGRTVTDPREDIGREILGALLDYPALLGREELVARLGYLDGDAAAAVAVLRRAWEAHPAGLAAAPTSTTPTPASRGFLEQVLAKLPASINPFAAARLAAPGLDAFEDARDKLLENLDKLRALALVREETEVVAELQEAAAAGNDDHEVEVLMRRQRALEEQAAQYSPRARGRDNASER